MGFRDRMPSAAILIALAALFVATTASTWAAWGHVRIDFGGALHRAERIADGAVLYRDVQVHYPPLAPYAMGGLLALFGKHLNVVYATGLILLLLQSCLLWTIARRFLRETDAALGLGAFWLLLAFQPGLFNWIVPNVFAGPFASFFATATLALLVADAEAPRRRHLVGVGLLIAATGLSKFEYGLAIAVTTTVYVLFLRGTHGTRARNSVGGRLAALAWAATPALLLSAIVTGILARTVPLEVILQDNLYRERSLSSALDSYGKALFVPLLPEVVKALLTYLLVFPFAAWLAQTALGRLEGRAVDKLWGAILLLLAAAVVLLATRHLSPDESRNVYRQLQFSWTPVVWFAIGWIAVLRRKPLEDGGRWRTLALVSLFSVVIALRWGFRVAWPAYYAVFAPFLVVFLVRTGFEIGGRKTGGSDAAIAVVLCLWMGTGALVHLEDYAKRSFELDYPRGFIRTLPSDGLPMKRVIDHLRREVPPGTPVAVLPEEQLINFLAETPHPTRDTGIGPGWLATPDDEARFLAEIDNAGTPLIVVSKRSYPEFRAGRLEAYEPDVVGALLQRYTPVLETRFYRVLERRDRLE